MNKETILMNKWQTAWHNFCYIMNFSDLTVARLALSASSILWAILLGWPGDTFGPTRQTYHLMAMVATEEVWAMSFLVQGLFSGWAVLFDRRDSFLILVDSILGGLLWTGSCIMMLMAYLPKNPPPAAISAEIIMAALSWWFLARTEYGR